MVTLRKISQLFTYDLTDLVEMKSCTLKRNPKLFDLSTGLDQMFLKRGRHESYNFLCKLFLVFFFFSHEKSIEVFLFLVIFHEITRDIQYHHKPDFNRARDRQSVFFTIKLMSWQTFNVHYGKFRAKVSAHDIRDFFSVWM